MTLEFKSFSLRLRFSFFAVLALMLLLCEHETTLLCFCSALLHEGGHLLLLRLFGAKVRAVTFGAAGVMIERAGAFLLPAAKEAAAALGGVAVNGLLCGFALLLRPVLAAKTAQILFFANAALAMLNLLPVYPLDCFRALHAALEPRLSPERLNRLLRGVSLVTVAAFAAFCVFFQLKIGRNVSLLAVCVYLLLLNLKRSQTDV